MVLCPREAGRPENVAAAAELEVAGPHPVQGKNSLACQVLSTLLNLSSLLKAYSRLISTNLLKANLGL